MSKFDKYRKDAWPYEFAATIRVPAISGGVPADPKISEGWIRSKFDEKDALIHAMVADTMLEREVDFGEATKIVDAQQNVNGFKRNGHGLYIEGRQVKAAIKEATSVAVAAGKIPMKNWGKTNKHLQGFVAEHVVVVEDEIPLGADEASGVHQRFIHKYDPSVKRRISAIHYEEYVENAEMNFTVRTDFNFKEKDWAMIWLTGEQQGIGASRSQGFGRYEVTRWESVPI